MRAPDSIAMAGMAFGGAGTRGADASRRPVLHGRHGRQLAPALRRADAGRAADVRGSRALGDRHAVPADGRHVTGIECRRCAGTADSRGARGDIHTDASSVDGRGTPVRARLASLRQLPTCSRGSPGFGGPESAIRLFCATCRGEYRATPRPARGATRAAARLDEQCSSAPDGPAGARLRGAQHDAAGDRPCLAGANFVHAHGGVAGVRAASCYEKLRHRHRDRAHAARGVHRRSRSSGRPVARIRRAAARGRVRDGDFIDRRHCTTASRARLRRRPRGRVRRLLPASRLLSRRHREGTTAMRCPAAQRREARQRRARAGALECRRRGAGGAGIRAADRWTPPSVPKPEEFVRRAQTIYGVAEVSATSGTTTTSAIRPTRSMCCAGVIGSSA